MGDLPPVFVKLKAFSELFTEDEIKDFLKETSRDVGEELDFESFLRVSLFMIGLGLLLVYVEH